MINQSLYADKLTTVSGILSVKDGPIEVMPGKYLIPGYSRYVIDKDLNITNIERNRNVTAYRTGNQILVRVRRWKLTTSMQIEVILD